MPTTDKKPNKKLWIICADSYIHTHLDTFSWVSQDGINQELTSDILLLSHPRCVYSTEHVIWDAHNFSLGMGGFKFTWLNTSVWCKRHSRLSKAKKSLLLWQQRQDYRWKRNIKKLLSKSPYLTSYKKKTTTFDFEIGAWSCNKLIYCTWMVQYPEIWKYVKSDSGADITSALSRFGRRAATMFVWKGGLTKENV